MIGGTNLDYVYKLTDESTITLKGVTQPCDFTTSLGGVARNMTEALYRLGLTNSILISTISDDFSGRFIREESAKVGMNVSKLHVLHEKDVLTGTYTAVFRKSGEISMTLGNMRAHDFITPRLIEENMATLGNSEFCVLDADIPPETMTFVCNYCHQNNIPVWFNPTDLRKCYKIIESQSLAKITYMSPNMKEMFVLFGLTLKSDKNIESSEKIALELIYQKYEGSINELENFQFDELKRILKYLLKFVPFIVLTRGCEDLILASAYEINPTEKSQLPSRKHMSQLKRQKWAPQLLFYPIIKLNTDERIANVSGAGDCTSSGIIAGILKNYTLNTIVYNGLAAAKFSLLSKKTVSEDLGRLEFAYVEKQALENATKIIKVLL